MGCDSWKDIRAAEAQEASARRLAETENVEVYGHSIEKMQAIQRYQAYIEICQYATDRSFLFQPVKLTVTGDNTFVVAGMTNDRRSVEIEFNSRKTREFSFRNRVSVATVKHWPEPEVAELQTA